MESGVLNIEAFTIEHIIMPQSTNLPDEHFNSCL